MRFLRWYAEYRHGRPLKAFAYEDVLPYQAFMRAPPAHWIGLQTASDFRRQYLPKHRRLSDFHSRAEYLHAGLLEGDPVVKNYVPQPFRVQILGRWYTPDCYVRRSDGIDEVVELKPRGEMRRDQRAPLEAFFAAHDMRFVVTSNESVLARAVEAENWLEIVRILHQAGNEPFDDARYAFEQRLWREGTCTEIWSIVVYGRSDQAALPEGLAHESTGQGRTLAQLQGLTCRIGPTPRADRRQRATSR